MKYRLLGIDLDGTLLRPDQSISDQDAAAIHDAIDAGVVVVPCTGRAWHEARAALNNLTGLTHGVFVTGAIVSDVATGRTLHRTAFDPELAQALVEHLADLPEAVLVFRDYDQVGHHYMITGNGDVTPNTQWWFQVTRATTFEQRKLTPDDLQHCVRVAVVSTAPSMEHMVREVRTRYGSAVESHSFEGVERDDEGHMEPVQILEIFPPGITKWHGLQTLAKNHGIADHAIAAIGDQVNDLPALRHAGCAVAMGNATPQVKDTAHHTTSTNTDHGVAHAIKQMLNGAW